MGKAEVMMYCKDCKYKNYNFVMRCICIFRRCHLFFDAKSFLRFSTPSTRRHSWTNAQKRRSQQAERLFGQNVHDPLVLPKVVKHWQVSIAAGQPCDMEFPLPGVDGRFRSFLTPSVVPYGY
jgi:hypothetical protein